MFGESDQATLLTDHLIMCLCKVGYGISNFAATARMDIGHLSPSVTAFIAACIADSLQLALSVCVFCTCKTSTQFPNINANASLYVQVTLYY